MINAILAKKKPIYFISPHVDDALLSSGSLIGALCKKSTVHIVTVFSECENVGKTDSPQILKIKRSIDKRKKIEKFLVDKYNIVLHYLDFPELIVRSNSVDLYKKLPHTISQRDSSLIKKIEKRLNTLVPEDAVLFCPLAVGGHLDHLLVRSACVGISKNMDIFFWKDYPYSLLFKRYEDSFVNTEFYKRVDTYRYSGNLVRKGIIIHSFNVHLKEFFIKKNIEVPILAESYFCVRKRPSK